MKKLLAIFVVSLFACFAQAEVVATLKFPDQGVVLLHDTKCPGTELMQLEVQDLEAKTLAKECWMLVDDMVAVIMEDGRVITTPIKEFKGSKWNQQS